MPIRPEHWQLVMVCWGTKYDIADINRLHDAASRHSPSLARTVLITDRDRPGLRPGIQQIAMPAKFSDDAFRGPGCQAKLCIFLDGVVPGDMPAIYCDLDSAVLGDLSEILADQAEDQLGILQSTGWPANGFTRLLFALSGKRVYARGNSSIIAFHPKHHRFIADRFLMMHAAQGLEPKPLWADERFMSWCAQPRLCFINRRQAVKFTREFMGQSISEVRSRAALPSTVLRRQQLLFVTFNQDAIKPSRFAGFRDRQVIEDRKGRVSEWSTAALGACKQQFVDYFS